MFVRTYSAAWGATARRVKCEYCAAVFEYPFRAFGLSFAGSSEGAVDRDLEKGCRLVPCPCCGKYQRKMVRRCRYLWLMLFLACLPMSALGYVALARGPELEMGLFRPVGITLMAADWIAGLMLVIHNPNVIPPLRLPKKVKLLREGTGVSAPAERVPAPAPAPALPAYEPAPRDDKVSAACAHCGAEYRIAPELLGRKAVCKKCGFTFEVVEKEPDLSGL